MFKRFRHLRLALPLAVIDLETTGANPSRDRIVELAILRVEPQGKLAGYAKRINPGMPIPPAASAVHGIRDADVAVCPSFVEMHRKVHRLLDGCDLAGFNLKRFDLPVLMSEFNRAGSKFRTDGRAILDVQEIFHKQEPRDLTSAARLYLGRELKGAHAANIDVLATAAVLDAQLGRYPRLPRTVAGLHKEFRTVDLARRFRLENGCPVFAFGKYAGYPLADVATADPSYLEWMLEQDFFDDAKALVRRALGQALAE